MPWDSFWQDANQAIQQILVSHKQNSRIFTKVKKQLYDYNGNPKTDKHGNKIPPAEGMAARGQLHKDTIYGKHKGEDGEDYFHVNKSLERRDQNSKSSRRITSAQVSKIVDPKIRKLIEEAIVHANPDIDLSKSYKIPNNAFFEYDEKTKRRKPLVFLPNENGDPIPVKSVRIKEKMGNAVQLKDGVNQYVDPQNNHHILIYRNKKDKLDEQVITFWEAVERKKQGLSAIELPKDGKEIIALLQINDLFLLNVSDEQIRDSLNDTKVLSNHLYRVQKCSYKDYSFRLATESTLDNDIAPYYIRLSSLGKTKKGWQRFNPVKVSVSPIGELELAEG